MEKQNYEPASITPSIATQPNAPASSSASRSTELSSFRSVSQGNLTSSSPVLPSDSVAVTPAGNGAQGQMVPPHLLRPHPHVAYLYQTSLPTAANNQLPSQHLSFQRKCLLAATSSTVIGLILMLVAVSLSSIQFQF